MILYSADFVFKTICFQSLEKQKPKRDRPAIIDSEAEDSPESSGDEYTHSDFNLDESSSSQNSTSSDDKMVETANTSKKLLNFVSRIAASNYFQKATENKYIKKAMENVSNCQLNLNVEVNKISGKLALNIPQHPSDRIWYGFVEKPQMTLVATPQVGEKEVSYAAISDWIADKLKQEFQVSYCLLFLALLLLLLACHVVHLDLTILFSVIIFRKFWFSQTWTTFTYRY